MTAYDDLMAFQRQTEALAQVAGRLGWDQETVMPRGAAEQRSEEMAAMEGVLHARRTDPRLADWLDDGRGRTTTRRQAQLRLIRRSYTRMVKVPGPLAQEIARVTSMAQGIWAEARANDDVAAFLPVLAQVVRLRQEEAAYLAQGGDLYDALIDDYEPGATAASIAAMFGADAAASGGAARGGAGGGLSAEGPAGAFRHRGHSCGWRAIWRRPSAMTGRAGGWIWRCIRSLPDRATMRGSPRGWSRRSRSTASTRRSTRSAMPAMNWGSTRTTS